MLTKLPRHSVVLVALLIFLMTGQTGVQGYVWCVEEDGEAALEVALNNSCRSEPVSLDNDCHDEEVFGKAVDQDDHCGPCLDIPATLEFTNLRYQTQTNIFPSADLPVDQAFWTAPALVKVLTPNLLSQPPPGISQTLLAHRTVVLLN